MAETDEPAEFRGTMLDVPKFAVSAFNISLSPTETILFCSSLMPGVGPTGEVAIGQRPEVVLSMSVQAAKELLTVLEGVVAQYEADFGAIRTPFLDERSKA